MRSGVGKTTLLRILSVEYPAEITPMSEPFAEGQEVIWTGLERNFARRVRIVAVRRAYRAAAGERPEDGPIVYDIADPTIKGTVYAIPGDQLEGAPGAVDFPSLPPLGVLVADDPFWRYPSGCAAGEGVARLRVWTADGEAGHLAVVTELGLGASVTNSIGDIWRALRAAWHGPLTLLEHWPAAESFSDDGEHLDQVITDNGRAPTWRRVWPVPPSNPDHARLTGWMTRYGQRITGSPARRASPEAGDEDLPVRRSSGRYPRSSAGISGGGPVLDRPRTCAHVCRHMPES